MNEQEMATKWWAHRNGGANYDNYGEYNGVEMEARAGVVRVWDGGESWVLADELDEDLAHEAARWDRADKDEIEISAPHDNNSATDEAIMLTELGLDSRDDADVIDERVQEALADYAEGCGLEYVEATDYGARWRGTPAQVTACERTLPRWAYHNLPHADAGAK